jgi:hypothetical protein
MSLGDYQQGINQGQFLGEFAVRTMRADRDEAIAQWKTYSEQLQAKLEAARKETICSRAREAGRDVQQKLLRKALAELDPAHPLLQQLPVIGTQAMAESFACNGYDYDVESGTLRKSR